ncbi:hypothetical protein D3C79_721860 [compost metagenome]
MRCYHTARADDADPAVAVEQATAAGLAALLQGGEVDVEADDSDDFAVFHKRESDAGDQLARTGSLVEVGLKYAGRLAVAGAGIERVVRAAAGAGLGIGQQAFVADDRLQFARRALHPVQGVTSGLVAAQLGLTGETAVGAVQGVGFENHVKAEQVGLVDQGLTQLPGQFLA